MWSTQEEDGQSLESAPERIAEDLRLNPLVLPDGEEVTLTVSVGNSRWRPGDDPGVLMSRLDEALYRAKTSGGDTVVRLG